MGSKVSENMNKDQLLELIIDYGVNSLRVGSYEARIANMKNNNVLKWKLDDILLNRQKALQRIKQELDLLFTDEKNIREQKSP